MVIYSEPADVCTSALAELARQQEPPSWAAFYRPQSRSFLAFDVSKRQSRQLTSMSDCEYRVVTGPKGSFIECWRREPATDGPADVRLFDIDAGRWIEVQSPPGGGWRTPVISPDGTLAAWQRPFSAEPPQMEIVVTRIGHNGGSHWQMVIGGTQAVLDWSPESRYLLAAWFPFCSDTPETWPLLLDLRARTAKQMSFCADLGWVTIGRWLPDGRGVLWGQGGSLWRTDVPSGQWQRLWSLAR